MGSLAPGKLSWPSAIRAGLIALFAISCVLQTSPDAAGLSIGDVPFADNAAVEKSVIPSQIEPPGILATSDGSRDGMAAPSASVSGEQAPWRFAAVPYERRIPIERPRQLDPTPP